MILFFFCKNLSGKMLSFLEAKDFKKIYYINSSTLIRIFVHKNLHLYHYF